MLYTDDAWLFEGMNTQVVSSLVRTLQQSGYHLVFAPIDESGSWEDIVLGGQIDGCVVFQKLPEHVGEALRDRQLPIVLLGDNSDPEVSQVVVDDVAGAYAATKHLIGFGHKRIAFYVHDSIKPHCSIGERLRGYRSALDERGLNRQECLQMPTENMIHQIVHCDDRPTGIVAYSNYEATVLVHSMWQYGIGIPRNISIVGFNDIFATRHMTPPLTSVRYDAVRIGELGAQLVVHEIESPPEERKPIFKEVKPKLVVRSSTGPPQEV
jgi:LacI family transcriptional regulator